MAVGQRLAKGLSLERTGITPIALACRRRCAHGMSVWGHERPKGDVRVESALPSTSNIGQRGLTRGASNCHQNRRAAGLIHIKTAVECLLQRIKGHRPAIAAAVASQGNMTHHWPRNVVLTALAIATAVIFPMGSPVQAQSSADQPSAVDSKSAEYPFGFKAYGAYQKMITEQNYAPVLQLNDVVAGRVTDAVGAVSGLRGEISMIDGRLIVSYGVDCGTACPPAAIETATLLAVATARDWRAVPIDKDLDQQATEAFIREQAKLSGLDEKKPFPFRINGAITNFVMHVNAAPNPRFKGRGSFDEMAITGFTKGPRIAGYVIGFYAPPSLQGVITNMGEFFHSHYIDEQRTTTAHLDSFGVAASSILMLPREK
jgi:hypothetical protein